MGEVVRLYSFRDAIKHADRVQAQVYRLEAALMLATAQRDASDLLLRLAYEELERVRGLIE